MKLNRYKNAVMPYFVRYHKTLSANAKLFYAELTAQCDKRGEFDFDPETLAPLYNVKRDTLQQWADELTQAGLIMQRNCENCDKEGVVIRLMLELPSLDIMLKLRNARYDREYREAYQITRLTNKEYNNLIKHINEVIDGSPISNRATQNTYVYCNGHLIYNECAVLPDEVHIE